MGVGCEDVLEIADKVLHTCSSKKVVARLLSGKWLNQGMTLDKYRYI